MPARFEVYVVPGSRRPGPDGRHGGVPRLRVGAPPRRGRANDEVERALSDILRCPVRVVGGLRNRTKRCEAEISRAALELRVRSAFGPGDGEGPRGPAG